MVLLITHGVLTWGYGAGEIPLSSFFPVVGFFYTFWFPSHFHCIWDDLLELNICYFQSSLCLQTHSTQWSCLHFSMSSVQFLHVQSRGSAVIRCLYPRGFPWGSPPWQTLPDTFVSHCSHFTKSGCPVFPSARHQSWLWPPRDSIFSAARLASPLVLSSRPSSALVALSSICCASSVKCEHTWSQT